MKCKFKPFKGIYTRVLQTKVKGMRDFLWNDFVGAWVNARKKGNGIAEGVIALPLMCVWLEDGGMVCAGILKRE